MNILIFDTETTGIPDYKKPSNDPCQPHTVSIGAILADAHGEEIERMHRIIRPDGWEIPVEVSAIHGITTERAMDEGIPADEAFHELLVLMGKADLRAAFNEPFDRRICRVGLYRHARGLLSEYGHSIGDIAIPPDADDGAIRMLAADWWYYGIPQYDVMKGMQDAMGVRKWPKLSAAYLWAFGREMPNAHSAIDDAHHTREVLQWMLDHDHVRFGTEWFDQDREFRARKHAEKLAARDSYD